MTIEVRPASSRSERKTFIRFPWRIYPGRYPAWVPPLLNEERKRISRDKNPFFGHGDVELFLAYRDGRPVGRIAAIENRLHNEFHGDDVGFFGLFEAEDDPEVAAALLDRAAEWIRDRGLGRLRGPTNFSTNEECGLLVDNFEEPPYVMMTYNPPYYESLLVGWGLEKVKDLLAYENEAENFDNAALEGLERFLERRGRDIRVRSLRMDRFEEEVALVRQIYNAAWERNWGFVPMTDDEVDHMARQLKPIVNPELVLFGEVGGKVVGFAVALPDLNQAIRHANGRLFPFGFIKLLWHMRGIDRMRILTLGLLPEYRRTGLAGLMYKEFFERGVRTGHPKAESSWVLEDNQVMRAAAEKMNFRVSKTYRLYERTLSP